MKERIYELIKECAPSADVPEIHDDIKIIDDLEYDSLCIISLFEEIESEFGIDIMLYEDIYMALDRVGNLIVFIEEKLSEEKDVEK